MIELFDASRLLPRRDRSVTVGVSVLALGLVGLGAHAAVLKSQIGSLQKQGVELRTELARLNASAPPTSAVLMDDLQREAERLEAELAVVMGGHATSPTYALTASQWLERLDALSTADIGVTRVEIDRTGSARIEGLAKTPQAMSSYVQAWERQQALAPMRPRAIELRQDDKASTLLRFQLRANLPGSSP